MVSKTRIYQLHYVLLRCISAAANTAGIPSVLITNFSFDSVFSYLATPLVDSTEPQNEQELDPSVARLPPDIPISSEELQPLVEQIWSGYRCADLLLRLPGAIPIPSFFSYPSLPSPNWVDISTHNFTPKIITNLLEQPTKLELLAQIPFPPEYPAKCVARSVVSMPLLVRSPNAAIYTPTGRDRLLDTIGVPARLRGPDAKILIVSFGGQIFHKPHSHSRTHSRSHSRSASGSGTPDSGILAPSKIANTPQTHLDTGLSTLNHHDQSRGAENGEEKDVDIISSALGRKRSLVTRKPDTLTRSGSRRSRAQSLLMVPGAPPATIPSSPTSATAPVFDTIIVPPTPQVEDIDKFSSISSIDSIRDLALDEEEEEGTLLPDDSWIAIVCGVPKDWAAEGGEDLPDSFFVAPKDVYMPDLTAIADVLLGKLVSYFVVSSIACILCACALITES